MPTAMPLANKKTPRRAAQRHGWTARSGGRDRPCRWHGRTDNVLSTGADALNS